jgi:hypothetical protein
MPGVVTFIVLGTGADPIDPPLARRIRWGARQAQMLEEFTFVGVEDDAPVFDFAVSRAADDPGPTLIGVDADGWYYDLAGAVPGEEADVSFDGDGLVFTTQGA